MELRERPVKQTHHHVQSATLLIQSKTHSAPLGDGHQGPAEETRADNDTPGPLETDRRMTSSNPSFLIRVWKGDVRGLAAPSSAVRGKHGFIRLNIERAGG